MVASTETTAKQASEATQTSPTPTPSTSTPTPKPKPHPRAKMTPQQARQSNISTALSCFLIHVFFSLVIHACVRSAAIPKPPHYGPHSPNEGPVLGAVLSSFPLIFSIIGIISYLNDVSPGLGDQTLVNASSAAVAGLAWVVFGVGEEAKFRIYLAWVMWPVVRTFGAMVGGAWLGVLGVVKEEAKREKKE